MPLLYLWGVMVVNGILLLALCLGMSQKIVALFNSSSNYQHEILVWAAFTLKGQFTLRASFTEFICRCY